MSDETQRYLFGFWTLIDEMLNSVLFLLIGLEVLVLRFESVLRLAGAGAVPLVLLGRLLAVACRCWRFGAPGFRRAARSRC